MENQQFVSFARIPPEIRTSEKEECWLTLALAFPIAVNNGDMVCPTVSELVCEAAELTIESILSFHFARAPFHFETSSSRFPSSFFLAPLQAWILTASALVMIMAPGVGFLYSGLLRRKNALSMMMLSLAIYSICTIEWFFWGYSLTYGAGSKFIGTLDFFGFMNTDIQPSGKMPVLLYAFYQSMFAALTPVIAVGGCAERARLAPILVVSFLWSTIVYNVVACWTWSATGWGAEHQVLDVSHLTLFLCFHEESRNTN